MVWTMSINRRLPNLMFQTNPTTVYDGVCHIITPSSGDFPSSIARQPRGCEDRTIRLRKALGEMFPAPTFLAPTLLSQLWRYRAGKLGRGGCDIDTAVYGNTPPPKKKKKCVARAIHTWCYHTEYIIRVDPVGRTLSSFKKYYEVHTHKLLSIQQYARVCDMSR